MFFTSRQIPPRQNLRCYSRTCNSKRKVYSSRQEELLRDGLIFEEYEREKVGNVALRGDS